MTLVDLARLTTPRLQRIDIECVPFVGYYQSSQIFLECHNITCFCNRENVFLNLLKFALGHMPVWKAPNNKNNYYFQFHTKTVQNLTLSYGTGSILKRVVWFNHEQPTPLFQTLVKTLIFKTARNDAYTFTYTRIPSHTHTRTYEYTFECIHTYEPLYMHTTTYEQLSTLTYDRRARCFVNRVWRHFVWHKISRHRTFHTSNVLPIMVY